MEQFCPSLEIFSKKKGKRKNKNRDKSKLNKQQKVVIELSDTDDEISIIPTVLSKENLGFVTQSENKHIHIADRIWDLRMDDKVYLFLNNRETNGQKTAPGGKRGGPNNNDAYFSFNIKLGVNLRQRIR